MFLSTKSIKTGGITSTLPPDPCYGPVPNCIVVHRLYLYHRTHLFLYLKSINDILSGFSELYLRISSLKIFFNRLQTL